MSQTMNVHYSVKDGVLTLGNDLFCKSFEGVESVTAAERDENGLSLPFTELTAVGDGRTRRYCVWPDLAVVYMPDYDEKNLMTLAGDHWIVRNVKLNAFTDEYDTLTEESTVHMFQHNVRNRKGEIFILENPEDGNAMVIISETPDHQTATLNILKGVLTVENGKNALALGFCKMGEGEALCRAYYRHARNCRGLVTMSNTWGDRNGFSRVCRDFVLREIEAGHDIGVDIVQIDDGWQTGSTADLTRRDARGRRVFEGDFWDLSLDRFPNGMREMTEVAQKHGIKVGMWFAPDSQSNFARLERDKAVLRKAYEEWGIRFFKLDMFFIESNEDRDHFLELLREIYSFGNDVAVQLDVTRNVRMNYLCGRQYGTVFVENRYHRSANSFPHRILRNLWMISRYIPSSKFQFELINPDLYPECYAENDPFAPIGYDMGYLFATVMLSNPLFWMEMQFLSDKRRAELKPVMEIWKQHRENLATADVQPIGECPSGRSISGFCIKKDGKPTYLLLFRENTERASLVIPAPVNGEQAEILISNGDTKVNVMNGAVEVTFAKERSFAFVQLS